MEDNQSPLTMSEAVQALAHPSGQRNPGEQDNPPDDDDDQGQEAPDEEPSEDDLAEGLTEEDEDNPEGEEGEGTPEEPEEKPDDYAAGRFAADDANVRLADGTVTTIAELKQGNLLQSDYSRKTLALAEERKHVEATKAQFATMENALAQQREVVAMIVNAKLPKPPDPKMMDPKSGVYDPFGFVAEKDAYERETYTIQQMIFQHQQMLTRQAKEAEAERERLRDQEAQWLFEKQPELRDPVVYDKFWTDAVQYVGHHGFTAQELNEVDDHRTYGVLKEAMAYRKLQAKVKEAKAKTTGKPQLLQSSARRSPAVVRLREANNAFARLSKSGSMKDGIAALLAREKVN